MKKLLIVALGILCGVQCLPAQTTEDVPFNGLIVDRTGKGIKARVEVKHTDKYTITNKKGAFGLTNIAPGDTLVVRYKKQTSEIPVGNLRSMRITWLDQRGPTYNQDEELVNTGFGYIKRREYTSGSTGISGERMIRAGFTDVQSAVLAMSTGVQLINGEIVIRGAGSVNSANAALIICDDIPVQSLNSINIHDVASVEVQKGSNMYGLRGGNGVIIVRTKSGSRSE